MKSNRRIETNTTKDIHTTQTTKFWVDYDREADVLSMSFDWPQNVTDSEMTDDGFLLRYRGKHLIGVTILDASTRSSLS